MLSYPRGKPNFTTEAFYLVSIVHLLLGSEFKNKGNETNITQITLTKIRSDITKFQMFWDSFESAVHVNTDLSSIDKFNYLKALVEGPAASAKLGLTLTEVNYSAGVELLKERNGKNQLIISAIKTSFLYWQQSYTNPFSL